MTKMRMYARDKKGTLRSWELEDISMEEISPTVKYFNTGIGRRELYESFKPHDKSVISGVVLVCIYK